MRLIFALLLFLAATASGAREFNPIRLRSELNQERLQATTGFGQRFVCNCESWRLAVEVNNIRNWTVVPAECVTYIGEYMVKPDPTESQYENDLNVLTGQALDYLQELPPVNRNNTFLFGLVNTLLSDLEYYQNNNFGGNKFEPDAYNKWLGDPSSTMKAVAYLSQVYYAARLKGFRIVILSGNDIKFNDILEQRLAAAGITGWDQFILNNNASIPDRQFKESVRAELLKNGSTVVGNVGDQWSDLEGINSGLRKFKVPNPMYYIP